MATRTFVIKDSDTTSFSIILAAPHLLAENLPFDTWAGAYVLSNTLYKISLPKEALLPSQSGLQILELGAGTGLAGLSAAYLWKANVLLTDLEELLPGMQANVELNAERLRSSKSIGTSGLLDWRTPSQIDVYPQTSSSSIPCIESNKPGVIVIADTIYDEAHPELLVRTISAWLRKNHSSRALICYPMRVAYIDYIRDFWDRMAEAGLEACEEGQEMRTGNDGFDDEKLCEWSSWKWSANALESDN